MEANAYLLFLMQNRQQSYIYDLKSNLVALSSVSACAGFCCRCSWKMSITSESQRANETLFKT